MSKEKEFNELYAEIYADIAAQFGAGDYIEGDDRKFLAKQIVEHLQEWGYRKVDEVRKETAKEILGYIREVLCKDNLFICDVIGLERKYGVEA